MFWNDKQRDAIYFLIESGSQGQRLQLKDFKVHEESC